MSSLFLVKWSSFWQCHYLCEAERVISTVTVVLQYWMQDFEKCSKCFFFSMCSSTTLHRSSMDNPGTLTLDTPSSSYHLKCQVNVLSEECVKVMKWQWKPVIKKWYSAVIKVKPCSSENVIKRRKWNWCCGYLARIIFNTTMDNISKQQLDSSHLDVFSDDDCLKELLSGSTFSVKHIALSDSVYIPPSYQSCPHLGCVD